MSTLEQGVRRLLAEALYMGDRANHHGWVLPPGYDRLAAGLAVDYWAARAGRAEFVLRWRYSGGRS